MSIPQFDNPLERLSVLPNVINWKGEWVTGTQYYMNDVVVEPVSTTTYILTGATAIFSETTPSSDPLWTVFSGTADGVTSIQEGAGISITGSTTNPTISNTGVLEILPGININIEGTTNPIISCSAIQEIISGNSGISIFGLPNPIISNTGVRTITVGAGLSSSGGPNPSLVNTGVISIDQGEGIEVLGLPNPIVSNTGVLQIIAGDNVTVSPPNGKGNVTVNANVPQLTVVLNLGNIPGATMTTTPYPVPAAVIPPGTPTPGLAQFLVWPTVSLADGIFKTFLANGTPDTNGIFLIDMTSYSLVFTGTGDISGNLPLAIQFQFIDQTTAGGPFSYLTSSFVANVPNGTFPFPFNLGQLYFDVSAARTAGLRTVDTMNIINNFTSTIQLTTGSAPYAVYYPNGIQ